MSEVVLLLGLNLRELMSLKKYELSLRLTLSFSFFSFCSVGKIGIGA